MIAPAAYKFFKYWQAHCNVKTHERSYAKFSPVNVVHDCVQRHCGHVPEGWLGFRIVKLILGSYINTLFPPISRFRNTSRLWQLPGTSRSSQAVKQQLLHVDVSQRTWPTFKKVQGGGRAWPGMGPLYIPDTLSISHSRTKCPKKLPTKRTPQNSPKNWGVMQSVRWLQAEATSDKQIPNFHMSRASSKGASPCTSRTLSGRESIRPVRESIPNYTAKYS